jgi:hypothetical protein
MPRLLDDLYAFFQEHRRCGELDGGGAEGRVWMTCECGAGLARLICPSSERPSEPTKRRHKGMERRTFMAVVSGGLLVAPLATFSP